MVAGKYPFERVEEKADPQRMNKMAEVRGYSEEPRLLAFLSRLRGAMIAWLASNALTVPTV